MWEFPFAEVTLTYFMSPILNTKPLRLALLAVCLVSSWLYPDFSPNNPRTDSRKNRLMACAYYCGLAPFDPDVLIKLRIHSGAAFDVSGKAGEMALLGDLLFPDPATREYFTDEMAAVLDVDTNYDSITVTMQGRPGDFDRMVGILRNALLATPLTPDNVSKIRDE